MWGSISIAMKKMTKNKRLYRCLDGLRKRRIFLKWNTGFKFVWVLFTITELSEIKQERGSRGLLSPGFVSFV